jgi:hypothetical protein
MDPRMIRPDVRGLLRRLRDDERGEIEDAPALILLIGGVLFTLTAALFVWGQYAAAEGQVQAAAFAAARDVSLSRATDTTATVTARAAAAARTSLTGNVECGQLDITVDDAGLRTTLGTPGTVEATVTCAVRFHTLQLPGIPTTATITKTAASPVDPYRER